MSSEMRKPLKYFLRAWVLSCSSRVQLSATPWTVARQAPSSLHGISQARILEWVAVSFSRGSSRSRHGTHVSRIGGQILYRPWGIRKAQNILYKHLKEIVAFYDRMACLSVITDHRFHSDWDARHCCIKINQTWMLNGRRCLVFLMAFLLMTYSTLLKVSQTCSCLS